MNLSIQAVTADSTKSSSPALFSRILRVSKFEPGASRTITDATQKASDGDQILVEPGRYGLNSKEKFPIYVPPRCQLIGAGADKCIIDGGGDREIADRPLNPFQSLILLGDGSNVSGFTIRNSGGNGVSNEQGSKVLITRNIIRDNSHHGILVFGTNGALVHDNHFYNNGRGKRKFGGPRPGIGKQGHHVYIEARFGSINEVEVLNNVMQKVFADAIANDMYDQPDGLVMRLQIMKNIITDCGRNGLSIVSSYGPSNTDVFADIQGNRLSQIQGNAIDLVATYSLVNRSIHDAKLVANVVGNEIEACSSGILAVGAYESAANCKARYNLIQNRINQATDYGIRLVGGYNLDNLKGWAVENTVVESVVADNTIRNIGKKPILIEAGAREKGGRAEGNTVHLQISGNDFYSSLSKRRSKQNIVIRHGGKKSQNQVVVI